MTTLEQYHEVNRRRAESASKLRGAMQEAANAIDRADWPAAFIHAREAGDHLTTYRRRLQLQRLAHERLGDAQ